MEQEISSMAGKFRNKNFSHVFYGHLTLSVFESKFLSSSNLMKAFYVNNSNILTVIVPSQAACEYKTEFL